MNKKNQWLGSEIRLKTKQWIFHLSDNDLSEIDNALIQCEKGPDAFGKESFPLSGLANRLEDIRQEVLNGLGFHVIKGLQASKYTEHQLVKIFWGLGLYLGEAVSQNAKGHLMGHVIDLHNDPNDPKTRIYTTNYLQPFHTDSCDVVGLLCIRPAREGGRSSIVSSSAIYNTLVSDYPDYAKVLSAPFYVDRKGEIPVEKLPYYQLSVFHPTDKHIVTIYARDFIKAAQHHEEVPRLTALQTEALDKIDELCASDEFRLDMNLEAGDIQLCHNHTILHARSSYVDHEDTSLKRHLLRLWLSQPDGWELPESFSERYGTIEVGKRRGGILVEGVVPYIPYEPI